MLSPNWLAAPVETKDFASHQVWQTLTGSQTRLSRSRLCLNPGTLASSKDLASNKCTLRLRSRFSCAQSLSQEGGGVSSFLSHAWHGREDLGSLRSCGVVFGNQGKGQGELCSTQPAGLPVYQYFRKGIWGTTRAFETAACVEVILVFKQMVALRLWVK